MEDSPSSQAAQDGPAGSESGAKNVWNVPTGRRTDEWSECLVLIGEKEDRAAFSRLFRHFAPLIKAFALSGSALSASHADELVQEVMLKIWQKASAFDPEKAARPWRRRTSPRTWKTKSLSCSCSRGAARSGFTP